MESYLSYAEEWLEERFAVHTAQEITQQPQIWQRLFTQLSIDTTWHTFLKPLLSQKERKIILCGAGSSAFVGMAAAPWLRKKRSLDVQDYSTTEIVADPGAYFQKQKPTLLVSYARSGNSPESVAAVQLANQLLDDCYHLIITCNPNSELTKMVAGQKNALEILMPEGTHDVGFAMTSSMSSMLLATILLFGFDSVQEAKEDFEQMVRLGQDMLTTGLPFARQLAKPPLNRLVYVGSSCFTGIAREAALKSLELTAGQCATSYDSTLSFRHGPKSIIDNHTAVVIFFSNNDYQRQYDQDLFNEIQADNEAKCLLGLSGVSRDKANMISLHSQLNDIWLQFPYLLFAQLVGFESSLIRGLHPDNPCPTGEVNRVVKGVTIYPYEAHLMAVEEN